MEEASPSVRKAASKAMADSLKDMSHMELDETIDPDTGLTCRQTLILRKLQWTMKKKEYPMGSTFYAGLRKTFGARPAEGTEASPSSEEKPHYGSSNFLFCFNVLLEMIMIGIMVILIRKVFIIMRQGAAEEEPIRPALFVALQRWQQKGTRYYVLDVVATMSSVNSTEASELASFTATIAPQLSAEMTKQAMSMVDAMVLWEFPRLHPAAMRRLSRWLNDFACFVHQKSKGLSLLDFIDDKFSLLSLLVPTEDLMPLRKCAGEEVPWADEEDLLMRVLQMGEACKRIFGFAMAKIVHKVIEREIARAIDTWIDNGDASKAAFAAAKSACVASIIALPGIDEVCARRQVCVIYRGYRVLVKVSGHSDHVALCFAAVAKEFCISQTHLEELLLEGSVALSLRAPPEHMGDCRLLCAGWAAARAKAESAVAALKEKDGLTVVNTLKGKEKELAGFDGTISLEINFFAMVEATEGWKALQGKVLELLPTKGKPLLLNASLDGVRKLTRTPLYHFIDDGNI